MTVVLLPGAQDPGALARTIGSLERQVPAIDLELVSVSPGVGPAASTGRNAIRRLRSDGARPDLAGCMGEWVAMVAVGDVWPAERMATALASADGVDAFYGDVELARRGEPTGRRMGEYAPVPPPDALLDALLDVPGVATSSLVMRRSAWDGAAPSPGAGKAWDLDLLLRLLSSGATLARLDRGIPVVCYPRPWTNEDRAAYLLGAVAAYGALAAVPGPWSTRAQERQEEARAELLIFTRYQGLRATDRLSVLRQPAVRARPATIGLQVAAALAPTAFRNVEPEHANVRPRTPAIDFLSHQHLHACGRAESLCARKPLVTVAIACYNHGRYLAAAVESARAQSYEPIEIVVVDDGSTDETPAVVARLGDAVRSFRRANAGPAATYNFAASVADGAFLLYLDADDELHPLYVQELLGAFCEAEGDASLGFVYSQMAVFGRERRFTWYPPYDRATMAYGNFVHSAALLRREARNDASFDDSLRGLEDWDFFLSLIDAGWKGRLVDLPLLRYRTHQGTKSRSDDVRAKRHQRELHARIAGRHRGLARMPLLRRHLMFDAYVRPAGR